WNSHFSLTDVDGLFAIDSVNEVPCWLWSSASGYHDGFPLQRELTERDTAVEIVLRRDAAALLDVRGAKTKQPIETARARAFHVLGEPADWLFLRHDESRSDVWDGLVTTVAGRLVIWCGSYTHELKPGATRSLKLAVFAEGYRPAELALELKQGEEL